MNETSNYFVKVFWEFFWLKVRKNANPLRFIFTFSCKHPSVLNVCITCFRTYRLSLVNDALFVRNATTEEIRHAFAMPAPTPSSSPVSTHTPTQQEMISAFSQKSQMDLEWSQKWVEILMEMTLTVKCYHEVTCLCVYWTLKAYCPLGM